MVSPARQMRKGQVTESPKPSSRQTTLPPKNPNKRPTRVNAERSLARLRAENRAVIYGYQE